jgi:hypothetical protein
MTPREIAALHEGGHVAAYVAFDDRVRGVALLGEDGGITNGLVRIATNTPGRDVLRSLSGPAGEYLIVGRYGRSQCTTDIAKAERIAVDHGLRIDHMWIDALALVRSHQGNIEKIAEALLRRIRLSSNDIDSLVNCGWASPRWTA